MKRRIHTPVFVGLVIMLGAAACNYPGISAPTPFIFPTPNVTMTAVFNNPTQGAQPTASIPEPQEPTSTLPQPEASLTPTVSPTPVPPLPSATMAPPTSTPVPPTATTPPTNTPVPTVSYAGPGVRTGPSMVAAYQNRPVNIDGSFDDWELDRYIAGSVVAGAQNWAGEADLSARVMWSWDENNLYLAARVKDDAYVQNASGEQIFRGDSLEILIDTNVSADFYRQALDADDFQLGISPGNSQPGSNADAYLWYPQSEAGRRQKVKIGAILVDDGYRIEASIPWSTFGITPKSGQHFGFAFSVSDNDRPGETVQQSLVSNVPARVLTDPTTWGDLALSSTPAITSNPKQRTGASVSASYLSAAPTLDGNLSEWTIGSNPINKVVFGGDKWDSTADLSGVLLAGWDENYLYLGVQVYDNTYIQAATGENLFLGDSLEVLFDTDVAGDYYQESLSGDDSQLGISPGRTIPGNGPEAYLWYPRGRAGGRANVRLATTATADGYILEAAIPWDTFGVIPANGQHYGFAVSISDNDNPERAVQQSMVSNVPSRVLTDPTTWGNLTLAQP